MSAITPTAAIAERAAHLRELLDREHYYSLAIPRTEATALAQQRRPLPCPPPTSLPPSTDWTEVIVRGYANEFGIVLVSICPHGSAAYDVLPDDGGQASGLTCHSARDAVDELRRLFA
ncbi:hypothetical protein ETD86_37345 [Nonomuraea turkmeniaca]|uniref:Uncharacterized protein n=1 Tax=Nonomuraea turkmeniaca TaxID=103838 RepID=A0A5S4F4Y6_9ACTN|nr:hypothetical protein [Nonomuraea turkmeniaca]TMR10984.1 hypothetical protein ETD86_37345 [Nonomuraea turkmeniaca]